MVAAAAANAFERGVEITLLTAASEHASHVFQRAGFRWYGTGLAYFEDKGRGRWDGSETRLQRDSNDGIRVCIGILVVSRLLTPDS
jgi:hypothetical protein